MLLQFGEKSLNVKPYDKETSKSNYTGNDLESFKIEINVNEKFEDEFNDLLSQHKMEGLWQSDESGKKIKKYKIVNSSYSYSYQSEKRTNFHYIINLEEDETLDIECLIIEGYEINPYDYSEEYDENKKALIINCKVKLSNEENKLLSNILKEKQYFNIIRKGINDNSIKMRFGKNLWSEHEGYIKKSIILVEDTYDKGDSFKGLYYPELENMQNMILYSTAFLDKLSRLLISKNILNEQEWRDVREEANNEIKSKYKEFYKVDDIDKEK